MKPHVKASHVVKGCHSTNGCCNASINERTLLHQNPQVAVHTVPVLL
jgi:hypothetical protein